MSERTFFDTINYWRNFIYFFLLHSVTYCTQKDYKTSVSPFLFKIIDSLLVHFNVRTAHIEKEKNSIITESQTIAYLAIGMCVVNPKSSSPMLLTLLLILNIFEVFASQTDNPSEFLKSCLVPSFYSMEYFTVVNAKPTREEEYDSIQQAIENKEHFLFLSEGEFTIDEEILIEGSNLLFIIGTSREKTILTMTQEATSIFAIESSKNVIICNLTLDSHQANKKYSLTDGEDSEEIYMASSISCLDCEHISLRNLIIFGSKLSPAIQFTSMKQVNYIDAFNGHDYFGHNNIIDHIHIETHDGLTTAIEFDLQKNGRLSNNVIVGTNGGINMFLNDNTECSFNQFIDVKVSSMEVKLPSRNISLHNNKLTKIPNNGIMVTPMEDYDDISYGEPEYSPPSERLQEYKAENITITNNFLHGSKFIGIEIAQTKNVMVTDNKITEVTNQGIFITDSDGAVIVNNYISGDSEKETTSSGIYASGRITNSDISNNSILSGPKQSLKKAIMIDHDSSSFKNKVTMNLISGHTIDEKMVDVNELSAIVQNNFFDLLSFPITRRM